MRISSLFLILASCSASPRQECPQVAVTPVAASGASSVAVAPRAAENATNVPFEVQNVTVAGAAELFTKRTGQTIAIDKRVLPAATCLRMTLKVGGAYAPAHVLDAFDASLAGSGLVLRRGGNAHTIVSEGNESAPRGDCSIDHPKLATWILEGVRRVDDSNYDIKRASLDLFLDRFFDFYPSTGQTIPGKPGIPIDDRRDFEIMAGIGAKSGDLIVAVQGEPITYSANVSKIIELARSAPVVVVDLERAGRKMKLSYRIVP
jgi:hypothetical protein